MARRLSQLAQLPVTELKGVGEAKAGALAKLGVRTVLDLLTYYPRRYLDRTNQARALLDFLAQSVRQEGPYSQLLKQELESLRHQSDHYLYH